MTDIPDYVIHNKNAVNPSHYGTKVCAHNVVNVPAKKEVVLRLRLYAENEGMTRVKLVLTLTVEFEDPWHSFDKVFVERIKEKDHFYEMKLPSTLSTEERKVMTQVETSRNFLIKKALAGLLWSKQFFYYSVKEWLEGDPNYVCPFTPVLNIT